MAELLRPSEPGAVIADQGMVYCRFPSGEIVACDAQTLELMKKINRGVVPLSDYGQYCSNAYCMDHPFEPLFQAGGARELSVRQITDLGYHLRPPLVPTCDEHVGQSQGHPSHKGMPGAGSRKAQGCWYGAQAVHFPQLEGITLPPAPEACQYCDRDDFPTERAFAQHQDVMHRDRRQQLELGQVIVQGLLRSGVISGSTGGDPVAIAAGVAAALEALGYGQAKSHTPDDDDDEDETPPVAARAPISDVQRARANELRRQRRAAHRVPITSE